MTRIPKIPNTITVNRALMLRTPDAIIDYDRKVGFHLTTALQLLAILMDFDTFDRTITVEREQAKRTVNQIISRLRDTKR